MTKKIYILYHANCTDGLGAKYAAWAKFGDQAEYIPVSYGKPMPELTYEVLFSRIPPDGDFCDPDTGDSYSRGLAYGFQHMAYCNATGTFIRTYEPDDPVNVETEIYILDFSYPLDVLNELLLRFDKVVVLDHHKTAQDALSSFKSAVFDMNKSGAVLAWEYFHPGEKVPHLLQHVQDRDLWKFELPGTKEVHAAISLEEDMAVWDAHCEGKYMLTALKEKGASFLAYEKREILKMVNKVKVIQFEGLNIGILNTGFLVSEVGAAICERIDIDAALLWTYSGKDVAISMRSKSEVDVAVICEKHFDGGGHKNAAGGRMSIDDLKRMYK